MNELENEIEKIEAEIDEASFEAAAKALDDAISRFIEKTKEGLDKMAEAFQKVFSVLVTDVAHCIDAALSIVIEEVKREVERDRSRSWRDCPRRIFPRGLRTVDKRQDISLRLRCAQISRR